MNFYLFFCFILALIKNSLSLSSPIVDAANAKFQAGKFDVISSGGNLNTTIQAFTFLYGYAMPTASLKVCLGIRDIKMTLDQTVFGLNIQIFSIGTSSMSIQTYSKTNTNPVKLLSVIYLISSYDALDINNYTYYFNPLTDSVLNSSILDITNCTVQCRSKTLTLPYSAIGNTKKANSFISGFAVDSFYSGALGPNATFGLELSNHNAGTNTLSVTVTVYGKALLSFLNIRYISYEQQALNVYGDKIILTGSMSAGCYYTWAGCNSSNPSWTNNTFWTADTTFGTYYPTNYFYGLSMFIVRYDATTAYSLAFSITAITISSGKYQTVFAYSGNPDGRFIVGYRYLILLQFACPSTGSDIYYVLNQNKCDNNCNNTIGQYWDSTRKCQLCGPKCYKCYGNATFCTQCYLSHFRIMSGNDCICDPIGRYDDNSSLICPACHYSCRSCTGPSASQCIDCSTTSFRTILLNSCICNVRYYDLSPNQICASCHYTCYTCSANTSTTCLTCLASDFRQINSVTNTCPCMVGYFNVNNVQKCSTCHYSCWTCTATSNTSCSTCNSTTEFRTNSSLPACLCQNGYYDNNTQICLICHVTCATCDGPTRYDCKTCDSLKFRAPQGTQCKCQSRYYQVNVTCYPCHYSCFNCTGGTKYECLNCNTPTTFRKWNGTSGQCYCQDGYVDISPNNVCQKCDRTCLTCSINSTTCITCNASNNRVLTGTSCPCISGFVETNLSSGFCPKCHYSCLTCTGTASTQCFSCNTVYRSLNNGSCLCLTGTYDNNITDVCYPCNAECVDCTDQYETTCKSCNATYQRQLVGTFPQPCTCKQRFFQNGNALMCVPCHVSCLTCSVVNTNCTSCDSTTDHRFLATGSRCLCQTHYYDVGGQSCLPCIATCENCSIFPSNCTSCYSDRYLSGNTCLCNNGTFEDPFQVCLPCHYTCKTCLNSATFCVSCPIFSNRTLNSGTCPCDFGYYDNNTVLCIKCPYSCYGCTGPDPALCVACPSGSLRTLQANKSCTCGPGYYDDGFSASCKSCKPTCQTCSFYSICITCYPLATQNRTFLNNDCKCITGFYDDMINPVCQTCHYSCASCTGGLATNCLTCQTNRIYKPLTTTCPCMDGFYEALQACYPCDLTCKMCFALSTNCTSCDLTTRYLLNNQCLCREGYFQNGLSCSPCAINCRTCLTSASNCLTCNTTHFTVINGSTCICSPGQYQNPATLICSACNPKCATCSGLAENNCLTCSTTSFRTFIPANFTCQCNPGYFDNGTATCLICDSRCMTCYGPTAFNCSSCYPGAVKLGSTCRVPVTCSTNFYYEGLCIAACPNTTYPFSNTCLTCINNCKTCTSAIVCTSCIEGYFHNSTSQTCNVNCPQGCYINRITKTCEVCPFGCSQCAQRSGTVVCQQCSTGFYLFNHTSCVDSAFCGVPNYVISNGFCYPCESPCQTCNNLTYNGCITCIDGYSLYAGQCRSICPAGFYSYQKVCFACDTRCRQCSPTACQMCNTGYYLTPQKVNPKCVTISYFYDPSTQREQKCHPNCYSCTNSSFSSCIQCNKFRGDASQMAKSGYCDCWEDSIDIGNGNCSFADYEKLQTYTKTLKSVSDSATYISSISSIFSANFISGGLFLLYQQSYSNYYFINSSAVLQTDQFLKEALNKNFNFYLNSRSKETDTLPRYSRRLVELQNQQSLFSRGDNYEIYLFDWAIYTVIIIASLWFAILLTNCALKAKTVLQHQMAKTVFSTIKSIIQESALIIIHLLTISEISIYATATFIALMSKISPSETTAERFQINWMKFTLSILVVVYYIGYIFRLLIGCCTIGQGQDPEKRNAYNPLKLLTFCFDQSQQYTKPTKTKLSKQAVLGKKPRFSQIPIMKKIYLPVLMIRLALSSSLIIVFSSSPSLQIMSSLGVIVLWTIYSLIFCPYPKFFKVFIHLNEIVYIAQISIMLMSIMSNQGSRIAPSYILLILNGIQIGLIAIFSFLVLVRLIYGTCEQNKSSANNKIKNIYFNQNQQKNQNNESQFDLNYQNKQSNDLTIIDLDQKVQESFHKLNDTNKANNFIKKTYRQQEYVEQNEENSPINSPDQQINENLGAYLEQDLEKDKFEGHQNYNNNMVQSMRIKQMVHDLKQMPNISSSNKRNPSNQPQQPQQQQIIIKKKYRAIRKPKSILHQE